MKTRKAIIFFSAGLGDALLLVPAIKNLKKEGYHVSGFFNSPMPCREMMENTGLLDELLDVHSGPGQLLLSLRKKNAYDLAVLNHFAFNRRNLLVASAIAAKIVTNKKTDDLLSRRMSGKISYIEPKGNVHDAVQNLLLTGQADFALSDLFIPALARPAFDLPARYTALQVSSGNPAIAYKNWPFENWLQLIALVQKQLPATRFVLLGNEHDLEFARKLQQRFGSTVISLAGKTSITQVMQVLSHCEMFLGTDSGLMHLAAALQKPTFSLWGPSSEKLYGYEQFDPQNHRCVRAATPCFPCNAWMDPNRTKARAPELCPDQACLKELRVQEVYQQYCKFVTSLPQHVR